MSVDKRNSFKIIFLSLNLSFVWKANQQNWLRGGTCSEMKSDSSYHHVTEKKVQFVCTALCELPGLALTTASYTYVGARSAMIRGACESPRQLIAEREVIAPTDVIGHTILLISLS